MDRAGGGAIGAKGTLRTGSLRGGPSEGTPVTRGGQASSGQSEVCVMVITSALKLERSRPTCLASLTKLMETPPFWNRLA